MSPRDPDVPPVGEEIHLPSPSLLPVGLAVAIALALVGITTFPGLTVVGGLLALYLVVRWIRETRRDIDELPLDQHP